MNWNKLETEAQLDSLIQESAVGPIFIFKHSTSCSISAATLGRFERNWKQEEVDSLKPYYLDLIAHRSVSNQIANKFGVVHESPQLLLIDGGECVYSASHYDITFAGLKEQLAQSRRGLHK